MEIKQRRYTLVSILLCFFIALTSQLTTMITTVYAAFSLREVGALSKALTLSLMGTVVGLPIFSRLADLKGSYFIYSKSLLLFSFCTFLTGFAPNYKWIEWGAFFIGIFGTPLIPIINRALRTEERKNISLYIGSTLGIALLLGPTIVLLLISHFGWQVGFWLNVPFGLLSFYLMRSFKEETVEPSPIFDIWSGILFTLWVATFIFILRNMSTWEIQSPLTITMCSLCVGLFVIFLLRENNSTKRFFNFHEFKKTPVIFFVLFNFFIGSVSCFYISLSSISGILRTNNILYGFCISLVPIIIGMSIGNMIAPKILAKVSIGKCLKWSWLSIVLATVLITISWSVSPIYIIGFLFVLLGIPVGVFGPTINSYTYALSPEHRKFGSTILAYFTFKMGGVILLSCMSYVLLHGFTTYLHINGYYEKFVPEQLLQASSKPHLAAIEAFRWVYDVFSMYLLIITFIFFTISFLKELKNKKANINQTE
ncbi:MFS transporter [Bacillus paramycoides]|uniref:MFS transporter n=1 Tax=Bacillus paramycoides TaxID=2026194 RepID=UPI003CFBFCFB